MSKDTYEILPEQWSLHIEKEEYGRKIKLSFLCQKYFSGYYIAIYSDERGANPQPIQFGCSHEEFRGWAQKLVKDVVKDGFTITEGKAL
jgi:hypothetical protein